MVPPKLSLPAVVGLIEGAAATVGVDTGLVHIAAALKRPTVELYNFATCVAHRRLLVAECRRSRRRGSRQPHATLQRCKSALARLRTVVACVLSRFAPTARVRRFQGRRSHDRNSDHRSSAGDWQRRTVVPRETLLAGVENGKVLSSRICVSRLKAANRRCSIPRSPIRSARTSASHPTAAHCMAWLGNEVTQSAVRSLIERYRTNARTLVDGLFPEYNGKLRVAPTSLRLHQVETRANVVAQGRQPLARRRLSVAAQSRRAHPARVHQRQSARRAARLACRRAVRGNGEAFLPRIKPQIPGAAGCMNLLHITKSPRSEYDHLMLHLHDAMKADLEYQKRAAGDHAVSAGQPGCATPIRPRMR